VYYKQDQAEANSVLISKLNELGKALSTKGVRLYLLGIGDVSNLDPQYVTYLGAASYEKAWDYLHFADIGIVVAAGKTMHNNESTKIYHYLRAGLPVVSESGFPNDNVVQESGLGFNVENGNMVAMSEKILEAIDSDWDREKAVQYVLDNHSWDRRVRVYDEVIRQHFQ
jgi:hypothetical protein